MVQASKAEGVKSSKVLDTLCHAVADDLAMLAALHDREPDEPLLQLLREEGFPEGLGMRLVSVNGSQALDLMKHALASLPEQIDETTINELAVDYAAIYLNYSIMASPEESVWIDEESLVCQDCMFQVRSWYEEYGLTAEDWRIRPDDHLVLQLQFLSHLFSTPGSAAHLGEVARFMDEHLLRWISSFAERVAGRCGTPYFAGVAMLTATYCEEIRDLLASILDQPRPSSEEIEERMRPKTNHEEAPASYMPGMGPAV
ncbi:MAG: molecular chaperone TorD family protein [Candidatus Sedimenticola sp. PURPLELP]